MNYLVTNVFSRTNQRVAIKILTADIYDGKNDTFELALLSQIRDKAVQTQGAGGERILGLLDDFVHDGPNGRHVCLVFPPMGPDLTVTMALYEYGRFPVSVVKQIARDMLAALAFLHDECGVIHTGMYCVVGHDILSRPATKTFCRGHPGNSTLTA